MNTKEKYTGFVYLWYDRKKKYYTIGSRFGNIDDGYITSTGIMKSAYKVRPEDFKRRILYYHYGDHKSLFEKEQYYLDMIKPHELFSRENIKNKTTKYYNIKPIASGLSGKIASDLRKEYFETPEGIVWKEQLSKRFKENNPGNRTGMKHTEEAKQNIKNGRKNGKQYTWTEEHRKAHSEKRKQMWKEGIFDNRPPPTIEHIEKVRQSRIGKHQTQYQKEQVTKANSKKWLITFPDGHEEEIENLNKFCREHNLSSGNMVMVAQGKYKHTKQYKVKLLS